MPEQRVRSRSDGQLGFVVEHEGQKMVRLDRGQRIGAEIRLVPYDENQWQPAPRDKLAAMGVARVAYDADRALRLARGQYGIPNWIDLRDQGRSWLNGPPGDADDERKALYVAIKKVIEK